MDLSEQSSTGETQSFQLYNLSLTRKFHIEADEVLDFFGHQGLFVMYFPISQIGSKLLHKGCLSCTTVDVSSQKHCVCAYCPVGPLQTTKQLWIVLESCYRNVNSH